MSNVNDTFNSLELTVVKDSENAHAFSFPCGIGLTTRVSSGILSFVLTVPEELNGTTKGLVGNFNRNITDDFMYPNGTVLSDGASDREIHEFGQTCKKSIFKLTFFFINLQFYTILLSKMNILLKSCMYIATSFHVLENCFCNDLFLGAISSEESLFSYPNGLNSSHFFHPDHMPSFVDEVVENASEEVLEACGDNIECIYDASQTGDISIGLETMIADTENQMDEAISGELE